MALPEPQPAIVADITPATEHVSKSIERALASHSMLDTPFTAEVDALEAARRARQSAARLAVARPVLLRAAAIESEKMLEETESVSTPYYLWAGTFFLLAAGLMYVGWLVLSLVLGSLFRRRDRVSDGNISTGESICTRGLS
jgi:hypothetical protein